MIQNPPQKTSLKTGIHYFFYGAKLCFQPGIRRFVFFPMLINFILFSGAFYFLYTNIEDWVSHEITKLPEIFSWLAVLIKPILTLVLIALFSYFFSTVSNWIAAPFNGLLSEKLELKLTGQGLGDESLIGLLKDIPRVMKREWIKLAYYIPKALGLFILLFIPVFGQTIAPILWFMFNAWMLSIQYCDYPFDNHKISFPKMKHDIRQQRPMAYGFGLFVALFTMVPFANLVIMPIAVCGATAMWVEKFKAQNADKPLNL